MFYEVYIPAPDGEDFDVTITVEAENWMSALKSGLERTGEGADSVRNVMCDIKDDDTIHVTDATTQRVFVLEELGEEAPDEPEPDRGAGQEEPDQRVEVGEPSEGEPKKTRPVEAVDDDPEPETEAETGERAREPEPTPTSSREAQPSAEQRDRDRRREADRAQSVDVPDEEPREPDEPAVEVPEGEPSSGEDESFTRGKEELEVGSSTHDQLQQVEEDEPTVVDEERQETDERRAASVGRQEEKVSETLIEDVFLEIQPIHEGEKGMEEVVNFVMDLAMDKIDAESGSILFADTSGQELYFAAARGPKAHEVMDFRVPMGEGIVGFCSKEGVSLAIGDAQEDPRFYEEISESLGYPTHSLLCSPIQYEGRVYGAIELVNKRGEHTFTSNEMNALSYIGRQLAEYVNRVVMGQENIEEE